jgi:F-type H+-transporting ATPase subunit delta
LVYLLISRTQLRIFGDIAAEYQLLADARRGVEHADVTTAIPIDGEDKEKIKQCLIDITGREIVLHEHVDPAIMGGMVVRIGDSLLDGSTSSKLEALRRDLTEAAM